MDPTSYQSDQELSVLRRTSPGKAATSTRREIPFARSAGESSWSNWRMRTSSVASWVPPLMNCQVPSEQSMKRC